MVRGEELIALKHPITRNVGGSIEDVCEVTMRRATAKDMRLFDQFASQPMALTLAMIEQLTGLTRIEVDKLDAEDVERLGELAMGSVGAGPTTGSPA